jgi:hypothetical protein
MVYAARSAFWSRCGHRGLGTRLLAEPPFTSAVPVERMDRLRLGGHAVDVRGAALEVVDQMGRILFRSGWIGIDPADRRAQCHLLRRRFSGMDWETPRLLDALDGAYDYYFDEMAQVRMPRW